MAALACIWLGASPLRPVTIAVDCSTGDTIGSALSTARPGDTVLVSGTCRESVFIRPEATRIVLNGQGKATIQHPGGVTARGPAAHGVYIRGGNQSVGIVLCPDRVPHSPDSVPRPNIIQRNGGAGIQVERSSSAWIVGNTIVGNNGAGIAIDRSSEADVVANTINGNRGDGIVATRNSGVNLQSAGSSRREGPNSTDPALKNRGVGVRCSVGGYVDGPLGSLTGMLGAKQFDSGCIDRMTQ